MNVSVFVTIWMADMDPGELRKNFLGAPLTLLKSNPAVGAVEFYTPEPGEVPSMDDIPRPTLIIQIEIDSAEQARALGESASFEKLFLHKALFGAPTDKINMEILKTVHFDLPGHDSPPPRTAPLSFVVRYYGPVKDAARFRNFYMESHPPILARFPGIRNVLCYLPVGGETGEISDARLVIGNEVVFDDLASLKAAFDTEVLQEAITDGQRFEPHGYNSHHAMHRESVYQR